MECFVLSKKKIRRIDTWVFWEEGTRNYWAPSGAGYTMFDMDARVLDPIRRHSGGEPQIFCGGDYDEIPFEEIYEYWNRDAGTPHPTSQRTVYESETGATPMNLWDRLAEETGYDRYWCKKNAYLLAYGAVTVNTSLKHSVLWDAMGKETRELHKLYAKGVNNEGLRANSKQLRRHGIR